MKYSAKKPIITVMNSPQLGENRRSRIGILGGTFDPIHHGHLIAATDVAAALDLDEVLLVPAGQPWQKSGRNVSAAQHRVAMTTLAVAGDAGFRVSRVDVDRQGDSYTVDTLRELRREWPDAELLFIIGADTVAKLPTWHRWQELFDDATFVVVNRPGYSLDEVPPPVEPYVDAGDIVVVEVSPVDMSSTEIRARVAQGRGARYFVPAAVADYIHEHKLYLG